MQCSLRRGAASVGGALVVVIGSVATSNADPAPAALPEAPAPFGSVEVTDDPNIVDAHSVTITSWSRVDELPGIEVHFNGSVPSCTAVHASATETSQTIVTQLWAGQRPGAPRRMCPMIVVHSTLVVPLHDPVGERTVIAP